MSKYFGASAVPRLNPTEGSLCTFAQPPSTIQSPVVDFVMPGILCTQHPQLSTMPFLRLHSYLCSNISNFTEVERDVGP